MSDTVYTITIKADNGAGSTATQTFLITVISATPPLPGGFLLQEDGTSFVLQEDGTSKIQTE